MDCAFTNNEAGSIPSESNRRGLGGAIFLQTDNSGGDNMSRFINCVFKDNNAVTIVGARSRGGAVDLPFAAVSSEWINCLFVGNSAGEGGAVYSLDAGPTMVNCTFTDNTATGSGANGGGIWMRTTATLPTLTNCIFWANSDPGGTDQSAQIFLSSGDQPNVTFSCIQGNDPVTGGIPFCDPNCGGTNNGNINDDPAFKDPLAGNYRLQVCSPCIDAANSDPAPADDQDVDGDSDDMELTPDLDKRVRAVDEIATPDTGNGANMLTFLDMGAFERQLAGDVMVDMVVDGRDIQPFIDCVLDPAAGNCITADVDFNGLVDFQDIPCFVGALVGQPCVPCGRGAPRGDAGNADCNANGIPDDTDIFSGTSNDCNANFIPDECDVDPADPDGDGLSSNDLNTNGIPDECEPDCNGNGIPDDKDIADGTSADLNANAIPDECDDDCNGNGIPDEMDIDPADPDGNGQVSPDCNGDGFPDECEADCNANGIPDDCDIDPTDPDGNGQVSPDCNGNGWPDECDMALPQPFGSMDCNANGIPDECDIDQTDPDGNGQVSQDCNANGFPDECDIAAGISQDANTNGIPDECEAQQSQGGGGSSPTPTATTSTLSESETEQAYADFYIWCLAQQWGTNAPRTCSQQFQAMVDKMRELGLPLAAP